MTCTSYICMSRMTGLKANLFHAGTFAWAAPEVLTNERCTEKADIYSLGIILW